MHNCKECPDDVKKNLLAEWARQRAIDGPATNTRRGGRELGPPKTPKQETPTARRLQGSSSTSPSCNATVSDVLATISATGRCDDGSDDSIASPRLAVNAVVKGIGRIIAINPTRISVALRKGEEAQEFKFSRKWIAPRTILQLSVGQLALTNISFLVADDDLACEDILFGLPVLRHLKIDSRTLLESRRDILDGADFRDVGNPTTNACGSVGRLMIARLQTVKGKSYQHGLDYSQRSSQPRRDWPRVDYYETRVEPDPYPDPSLLDPIDSDQHEEIETAIKQMLEIAHNNSLHPQSWERLKSAVHDHIDFFRVGLSRGPPAKLPPLKIDLTPNAAPVKVKLRNYTQDQRKFLRQITSRLVDAGMAYPNPAARWASAPLIVPKPGTSKFRFTVDVRLFNRFTIPHHYPMPLLENEMTKLSGSTCFANFDLSMGYWQLALEKDSQDCQSFLTPDGVFTPTRVIHGTTNEVSHLQSSLSTEVPAYQRSAWMHWLDDILLHDKTDDKLVDDVICLLRLCTRLNMRLHLAKCTLYAKELRWCRRLLSATGWRYDPRNVE